MSTAVESRRNAVPAEEYDRQRQRPEGRPIMYHKWRDLLFLHFPVEASTVQGMLPPGLTVDTFPGATGRELAWIGIVAFRMFGIRPRGLPPIPMLSAFPETNVRTYVHREGRDPGVWFFSLDAKPKLACRLAKLWYHEPYTHARIECSRVGDLVHYECDRLEGEPAWNRIACEVGDHLPPSEPGTFQYFACERYRLYTSHKLRLYTARVWHEPYPLRGVELKQCDLHLVKALGLEQGEIQHACFSDGVDTEIYPIRRA